jgi:hypothetical protein
VQWIELVYQTYGYTDQNLIRNSGLIDQDWQTANALLEQVIGAPAQGWSLPNFESLELGAPSLNFTLNVSAQWGGNGGNPFQDVTRASVLSQTTLTQLSIEGDKWIDNLTLTYSSPSGSNTVQHGGSGGSAGNPLQLQPGEFIKDILGSSGDYINQVALGTTQGRTLTGPPSPQKGTTLFGPWLPPTGSFLLGFQGRCDKYLDQLAPIVCTFGPAIWA